MLLTLDDDQTARKVSRRFLMMLSLLMLYIAVVAVAVAVAVVTVSIVCLDST